MHTVIKLSANYQSPYLAQFIDANNIKFVQELVGSNKMTFSIPITNENIIWLQEYRKIELYDISSPQDISIWSGYIASDGIKYDDENVFVECIDEKGFMKKKILYAQKTYSSEAIADVLDELVTEANTRAGVSELSYSTSLTATVTKTFEKGKSYYDIFNEIAELLDVQWTVYQNEIKFETSIGSDRTTGDDFIELVSNKDSPDENNISFEVKTAKGLATAILGKGGSTYQEAEDLTTQFGRIEEVVSFSDGGASDLQDQVDNYLDTHKVSQQEIDIRITDNSFGVRDLNIGDTVQVRINRGNTFTDIEDNLTVIEKSVSIVNTVAIVGFKVSSTVRETNTPQNQIAKLFSDVKKLQLQ